MGKDNVKLIMNSGDDCKEVGQECQKRLKLTEGGPESEWLKAERTSICCKIQILKGSMVYLGFSRQPTM